MVTVTLAEIEDELQRLGDELPDYGLTVAQQLGIMKRLVALKLMIMDLTTGRSEG